VIDTLGKHSGEEQGVVADMFADLALTIEGGCGPEYRVRLKQHFADIGKRLACNVAQLEELLSVTEFSQQVCDVANELRIADSNFVRVMARYQVHEKLLQWVIVGNHECLPEHASTASFAIFIAPVIGKQVTFVSRPSSVFLIIRNPRHAEGFLLRLLADDVCGCQSLHLL
jgi:hypothetical protein